MDILTPADAANQMLGEGWNAADPRRQCPDVGVVAMVAMMSVATSVVG